MLQAGVGHPGTGQDELPQGRAQRLQLSQTGIGDLRTAQVERLEVGESLQRGRGRIADAGAVKASVCRAGSMPTGPRVESLMFVCARLSVFNLVSLGIERQVSPYLCALQVGGNSRAVNPTRLDSPWSADFGAAQIERFRPSQTSQRGHSTVPDRRSGEVECMQLLETPSWARSLSVTFRSEKADTDYRLAFELDNGAQCAKRDDFLRLIGAGRGRRVLSFLVACPFSLGTSFGLFFGACGQFVAMPTSAATKEPSMESDEAKGASWCRFLLERGSK